MLANGETEAEIAQSQTDRHHACRTWSQGRGSGRCSGTRANTSPPTPSSSSTRRRADASTRTNPPTSRDGPKRSHNPAIFPASTPAASPSTTPPARPSPPCRTSASKSQPGHLHEIAFWVYQDACPPANGCTMQPPPLTASGTPDITAWQYAQSPRRKEITAACGKTYAPDNNCYAPGTAEASCSTSASQATADPSHGR